MVGKISKELKDSNPDIDWRKIYALRNVIAHDYFGVFELEVWQIIKNDLPIFEKQLIYMLDK
jgi:uncharacterized protein with HEPN domain